MRPIAAAESFQTRSRKPSLADPSPTLTDPRNASPMTFFLSRSPNLDKVDDEAPDDKLYQSQSPQETINNAAGSCETIVPRTDEQVTSGNTRRKSTIKPMNKVSERRDSSVHSSNYSSRQDATSLTPLLLPSADASLPSSPKSTSTRSLRRSDEQSLLDETGSQVIASSEEEEPEPPPAMQDSAPQLIMPSIRMPSRRPFTARGKRIGRYKILVAGSEGSGKTSLIKSIVQTCKDIVHVDPLTPSLPSFDTSTTRPKKEQRSHTNAAITEIFASTKAYPSWWSEVEDSKILRRRRSMGDAILERNLCFVDTSSVIKVETVIDYMEQQLQNAVIASNAGGGELVGLLSGSGGGQVDLILYLISQENVQIDCERMSQLAELGNVVPVIAKSDLLSADQIQAVKDVVPAFCASSRLQSLPVLSPTDNQEVVSKAHAPYSVSSTTGPDMETMDASLLMSPDYVQPLLPSELAILVDEIFETDVILYLRHSAAKKLTAWQAQHPRLARQSSSVASSAQPSAADSPIYSSLSNSGVLVPFSSDVSLTTSNSHALTRLADHTQREERLAQVRLSKWASDLQLSLQRERERYERIARGDRAVWLVEKIGEEVRDGRFLLTDGSGALIKTGQQDSSVSYSSTRYATHDPLGLLRWNETMRTRGWVALQVFGSFGVIGGLALWLAKTWGYTTSLQSWAEEWGITWFEMSE